MTTSQLAEQMVRKTRETRDPTRTANVIYALLYSVAVIAAVASTTGATL